jgi:hypothetical protein
MSLSDILVCVDSTQAGGERLRLALRLAHQHGAYLTAAGSGWRCVWRTSTART